jgi:membrane protein DedA with SNARE-associated domain
MLPVPFTAYAYLVLVALAIVEGPFLSIACGVAAALGYLNPFIAYGILIFGDVVPDVMYYWIGRYGATLPWVRRAASKTRLIREHFLPLERLWKTRLLTTMTLAKLSYGIAPPLIVTAGLSGVPFGPFVRDSIIVSSIYLGLLALVGYGFARAYGYVDLATGAAPYIIGAGGLLVFGVLIFMMREARRRLNIRKPPKSNLVD